MDVDQQRLTLEMLHAGLMAYKTNAKIYHALHVLAAASNETTKSQLVLIADEIEDSNNEMMKRLEKALKTLSEIHKKGKDE